MNRDEILAKSRADRNGMDERELQIYNKAGAISKAAGGVICALISFFVTLLSDDLGIVTTACWTIYAGMAGTEGWICAIQMKNKKMYWVAAIIFTVIFVLFAIFFAQELIAWTKN